MFGRIRLREFFFSFFFCGLVVYRSRAPSLEKKEMIMDQSFSKHVQLKRAPSAMLCCNNMQLVVLVLLASLAAHIRYPVVEAQVPVSFTQNYLSSTDPNHIRVLNAGGSVDLVLDQYSGRQLLLLLCFFWSHPIFQKNPGVNAGVAAAGLVQNS